MSCFNMIRLAGLLALIASPVFAQDASLGAMPRVLDERLKLELFAEHPMLVTPTGIDVDHLGRVWVLESNTHFPPDGYQGHPSDRLLVLQDTDGDGKADKTTVFADGFKFAMSVAVQPVWLEVAEGLGLRAKGQKEEKTLPPSVPQPLALSSQPVFVATRGEIVRLRDTNNDLVADERIQLVHLETAGNYPHNGLAGLAFDALGWMYFGFGENLGADYKIIGSDGVTLSGGGEGGNMYRCRPDGSKLEKWATGFWNPHASCFDAFGRLFTVDNDPDSRPPCRLLHIIPGGDYGYRFRNGRRGTHPFTAWNGEIPGTLPMVSGTGEAPSGILCYESDGFPADYLGTLLVGTWGDHRIDQFVLEPKGASFVSKPKPIVQGTENFRPVGLALAPDGSIYFSDWVLRDYKLHRRGRIWRLSAHDSLHHRFSDSDFNEITFDKKTPAWKLLHLTSDPHLPIRRIAAQAFVRAVPDIYSLLYVIDSRMEPSRRRVELLWAYQYLFADQIRQRPKDANPDLGEIFQSIIEEGMDRQFTSLRDYLNPAELPREGAWSILWNAALSAYDPFIASRVITAIAESDYDESDFEREFLTDEGKFDFVMTDSDAQCRFWAGTPRHNIAYFLAARRKFPKSEKLALMGLYHTSQPLRRAAVQWVGEEKLTELRPQIETMLNDQKLSPDLLMPCLATLSLLDGVPPAEFEKTPPTQQMLKIVTDDQRPASLRATALRMIPAATKELSADLLMRFAKSEDAGLKTEAVRTLQQSPRPEALPLLLEIAANPDADVALRCDAIAGLCATPHDQPLPANVEQLLLDAVNGRLRFRAPSTDAAQCQLEAIRALRGRATPGSKIGDVIVGIRKAASDDRELVEACDLAIEGKSSLSSSDSQLSTLNSQPSPDNGRRVFYHHQGPLCFKCHTVNGRGGNVGPDLSVIARTMNREKLLGSILEPSKEISPQFLTWTISTVDGKTHSGIIVTENGGGDVELGDIQGNVTKIPRKEIEERTPSNVSVMPQGLHQRMTRAELGELLDFLETLK